jgi:hypothetical protein
MKKIITPNEDVLCFNIMKKSIKRNINGKINYANKVNDIEVSSKIK